MEDLVAKLDIIEFLKEQKELADSIANLQGRIDDLKDLINEKKAKQSHLSLEASRKVGHSMGDIVSQFNSVIYHDGSGELFWIDSDLKEGTFHFKPVFYLGERLSNKDDDDFDPIPFD